MNGWLIIDKPLGLSSAQVVGRVKWLLKNAQNLSLERTQSASGIITQRGENNNSQSASGIATQRGEIKKLKIGHAGTLDPLASGVLPLAIGEATKVVQFLTDADKAYEFEVTWGEERSTDDAEGEVVQMSDVRCQMSDIKRIMEDFIGEIEQIPPQHSAIKIDGKRAYDIARSGEIADIKTRKITIYKFELLSHTNHKSQFTIHSSKGTYIRSIARDMGRLLGCYGYVSCLRRTNHGKISIDDAISLEKLEELCQKGIEQQAILPVDDVLDDIPELKLSEIEAQQVRNGIVLNTDLQDMPCIRLYHDNVLIAIAEISEQKLKSKRVFNL